MPLVVAPTAQHPRWYFEAFPLLFSVGRDYAAEVCAISRVAALDAAAVEEIGAGTGNHAAAVLANAAPRTLTLFDWDAHAATLLRARFEDHPEVTVLQADGFRGEAQGRADTVIAMQSIVQETRSREEFGSRIRAVAHRLSPGGSFVFEIIDATVSRTLYRDGVETPIYRHGDDELSIATRYDDDSSFTIRYRGRFHGQRVEYDVPLLTVTAGTARILVEAAAPLHVASLHALDQKARRLLVCAKRL